MSKENQELTKEELRKRRRKHERIMAFLTLASIVAGILVVLVVVINIALAFSGHSKSANEKDTKKSVSEKEQTEQNEISGNETVSENDNVSSNGTTNISEEEQLEIEEEGIRLALDEIVGAQISGMTIEEKVAGLFFVTPYSITGVNNAKEAGESTNAGIGKYPVGGIIYDEGNIDSKEQFMSMIQSTQSYSMRAMFFGVTDESGGDSPFVKSGLLEEKMATAKEIAADGGVAKAYGDALTKATYLSNYGININFAPTFDPLLKENAFIKENSFGSDIDSALSMSVSSLKGYEDKGMFTSMKYFPGYGDSTVDPRRGTVKTERTKEDLMDVDYENVRSAVGAGADFIMVSHVVAPNITGDPKVPACMSKAIVTDMLREDLKFDGIIITDYMNQYAITRNFKQADAAVSAIEAGCDMILVPSDFKKSYEGVLNAITEGKLSEKRIDESLTRIFKVKYYELAKGTYLANQVSQ